MFDKNQAARSLARSGSFAAPMSDARDYVIGEIQNIYVAHLAVREPEKAADCDRGNLEPVVI